MIHSFLFSIVKRIERISFEMVLDRTGHLLQLGTCLALLPRLLTSLPKSGGWLNSVKVTMGFLEVAASMKFLSNADLVWGWHVFRRDVVLAVWISIARA
jgi:hypothetical protein